MKKFKIVLIIIVLINLYTCNPPVTFTEPQPAGTNNLNKFPERLTGEYLSTYDSSILKITDKLIVRTYDFDYVFFANQLDSNLIISGDTIIDTVYNEKTLFKKVGDSLIHHVHNVDTLFLLNNENILKKFKGFYFINILYVENCWVVKKIQIHKGELTVSSISSQMEIDNLKEITEMMDDTVPPYNFTVTKKQFKEFVVNDGFSEVESFVRLKK